MTVTDPAQRTRILTELAQQQARQRDQHVTELADLHGRITALRAEIKTTEQTYRTALTTGPQLRSLGLAPVDARRRPRPTPAPASTPTTATVGRLPRASAPHRLLAPSGARTG